VVGYQDWASVDSASINKMRVTAAAIRFSTKVKTHFSVPTLRLVISAALVASTLGMLSACGSSNPSHLAYVAGGRGVSAYRINNRSGSAAAILGSPFLAGNSPSSVVVHASNRFLFVANQVDSTISLFRIDSTSGTLTEVLPRTNAGLFPSAMTMDAGGNFLFVANQGSNDVTVFSVSSTGALSQVSNFSVGSVPAGLAITSSGNFLFVPVPNFSSIYAFSVSSGALQFVGSFFVVNGVAGIAVDPGGNFLYATNPSANTVSGFAIQPGGTLSPVPGVTFAAGTVPVAAAVDLSGKYLYVANSGSTVISQYTIDATTGDLTALTKTAATAGSNPAFIVDDRGGKFVFVGNTGASSITEMLINSDGSLTVANTISLGFVPRWLAATK
jgi:6-phosphogluconolactonase